MALNLTAFLTALAILFAAYVIDDSNARAICEQTHSEATCLRIIQG